MHPYSSYILLHPEENNPERLWHGDSVENWMPAQRDIAFVTIARKDIARYVE